MRAVLKSVALVGLGGFAGAVLRYGVSQLAARYLGDRFPYGTLLINVVGCFALGAFAAWALERDGSEHWRLLVAVGVLGSFTTFSTFGVETLTLLRSGDTRGALLSVAANVGLGLLAAWSGAKCVGERVL